MNRISASRLWDIAQALDVSISFFFEGFADEAAPAGHSAHDLPERGDLLADLDGGDHTVVDELAEPVVGSDGDVGPLARRGLGEEVRTDVVEVLLDEVDLDAGLLGEGHGSGRDGRLPRVVDPDREGLSVRSARGAVCGAVGAVVARAAGGEGQARSKQTGKKDAPSHRESPKDEGASGRDGAIHRRRP